MIFASVLEEPVPRGTATVHGDLHVGQLIRDMAGKVWIIDLDDLALGPPEADLANFSAHLATSLQGGIQYWTREVQKAWTNSGRNYDEEAFVRFLRFSLVRRHLKLKQFGRSDFEQEIADYLRDSSNFSIL